MKCIKSPLNISSTNLFPSAQQDAQFTLMYCSAGQILCFLHHPVVHCSM